MLLLQICLALSHTAVRNGLGTEPGSGSSVAVAGISYDQRHWSAGRSPSLTFTVSSGRGTVPEKVAAFLYFSEVPGAFQNSPFPPQFVGVLTAPSSVQVITLAPPERAPINEFTREKFVQGAIFDVRTGALVNVTNEDYLDIAYAAPPVVYALDFETEDDFTTPLVNGQDLSTPPEFGTLLSLSAQQPPIGPPHRGPAIFDSDPAGPNAGSSDPDLLVGLGNVLMLQENPGQTVPGIFDLPDDAANGGVLVFDFTGFGILQKVEPRSVDLIDIDGSGTGAKVFMTDVLGQNRFYTVPSGWTEDINVQGPPGFRTLDLTTLAAQPGFTASAIAGGDPAFLTDEVVRIEITLLGSGAVDNLVFAREADNAGFEARAPKGTRQSWNGGTPTR